MPFCIDFRRFFSNALGMENPARPGNPPPPPTLPAVVTDQPQPAPVDLSILSPRSIKNKLESFQNGREMCRFVFRQPDDVFKSVTIEPTSLKLDVSHEIHINLIWKEDVSCEFVLKNLWDMTEQEKQSVKQHILKLQEHRTIMIDAPRPNIINCHTHMPLNSLRTFMDFLQHRFPKQGYEEVAINSDLIRTPVWSDYLEKIPRDKAKILRVTGEHKVSIKELAVLVQFFNCEEVTVRNELVGEPESFEAVRVQRISICNATSLTLEHFQKISAPEVIAYQTNINTEQIIGLIDFWANNADSKLKFIILTTKDAAEWEWDKVVKTFHAQNWDPKDRAKDYCLGKSQTSTPLDCSQGFDIRKKDLIATMVFKESFFAFVVWHKRFPEE